MKKPTKTSELAWIFGTIFVALGVAVCSKANLGVSMIAAPPFIISEAISKISSFFTVGVTEYLFQGILLAILCVCIRRFKWKYLLSFAVAVIYGYTLDLFLFILDGVSFDTVWLRWIMLVVGDSITALGVACFFRTYLPLQIYELFVKEFSERYSININKMKSRFDYTLLAVSVVLSIVLFMDVTEFDWSTIYYNNFHNLGLGTIVTTLINSPLIAIFGKLLDKISESKPLFPRLADKLNK